MMVGTKRCGIILDFNRKQIGFGWYWPISETVKRVRRVGINLAFIEYWFGLR